MERNVVVVMSQLFLVVGYRERKGWVEGLRRRRR